MTVATRYYDTIEGENYIIDSYLIQVAPLRVCREGYGYNKASGPTAIDGEREYVYDHLFGKIVFQYNFQPGERVMVRYKY